MSTGRKQLAGSQLTLSWLSHLVWGSVWSLTCRSETQFGLQLRVVGVEAIRGNGWLSDRNVCGNQALIIFKRGLTLGPDRASLWPRCFVPGPSVDNHGSINRHPWDSCFISDPSDWLLYTDRAAALYKCKWHWSGHSQRLGLCAFWPKNILSLKCPLHVSHPLHYGLIFFFFLTQAAYSWYACSKLCVVQGDTWAVKP